MKENIEKISCDYCKRDISNDLSITHLNDTLYVGEGFYKSYELDFCHHNCLELFIKEDKINLAIPTGSQLI